MSNPFGNLPPAPTLTTQQSDFISSRDPVRALDAKAGTGKTFTALRACAHLPVGAALAFNVRIKDELAKKLPAGWQALTMNGLGHRAWGQGIGKRLTLSRDKLYELAKAEGFSKWRLWGDVKRIVDHARALGFVPSNFQAPNAQPVSKQAIFNSADVDLDDEVWSWAQRLLGLSITAGWAGTIDFSDQLYLPVVFGVTFPRFPTLFVDEAQDLSILQHMMVKSSLGTYLLFAGDPNQAIYAWRGALDDSFDQMVEGFGATRFPLTASFRCPQLVVREAQYFVPAIEACDAAPEGEVQGTFDAPLETLSRAWLNSVPTAVLCRNNAPLISAAFRLLRNSIPCTILGRDFAAGLKSFIQKHEKPSLPETIMACRDATLNDIAIARANEDETKVNRLSDRMGAIVALAEGSSATTLPALLSHLDKLFSEQPGRVTLSTIHKSKGLEWPQVVFLAPDLLRLGMGQEENLAYVAITRAQQTLRYLHYRWELQP